MKARVRIYDRDGTLKGTLSGLGLSWSHGKGVDASDISFSGHEVETALAADPAMLDDAVALVQVDYDDGNGWQSVGTPYLINPSGGTVFGPDEGGAKSRSIVGKGMLMLTAEWPILHQGGVVNRRGPDTRYFGWMSPSFDDTGWDAAVHYGRSPAPTTEKARQPAGWPDPAADWINSGSGTGGLVLLRGPSFTVSTAAKYLIVSTADEEHKVYLNGPGWGGVIIDASAQETGYTDLNAFAEVLEPGTYSLAAEYTVVTSAGGDGLDAFACSVMTVDSKGKGVLPAVTNTGSSSWKTYRQTTTAERPGLPLGELLNLLRDEADTWGIDTFLLQPSFSDTVDSDGSAWGTDTERSWPVGTSVASALSDLQLVADFDARGNNNFDAYVTQGTDLSASVMLYKGTSTRAAHQNIVSYTWEVDPVTATRAIFKTQAGFGERIDAGTEATVKPRAVFLESSQAVSIGAGKVIADAAIREGRSAVRRYTAEIIPVAACLPFVDFGIGDTIHAYDHAGIRADLVITSISGRWDDTLTFTVELSE